MDIQYEEFPNEISFSGFNFQNYYEHEKSILEPQLRELGYEVSEWVTGERDSFGPLTRYCVAKKGNETVRFIYG